MAEWKTAESSGHLVLEIYAHFRSRPGHVLRANNFVAVAAKQHIPLSDIQRGIEYARENNWIESTENGSLRLTSDGYRHMPQLHS